MNDPASEEGDAASQNDLPPSVDLSPNVDHSPNVGRPVAHDLLFIAVGMTLLLLPAIFATELTRTDEARYTQVAVEMRLDGRWLAPRLNGIEYWQKPALFFDLLQIPQRLTGKVTAAGSRLVVLPFAMATLLLTYAAAFILAGRRAARWAAFILATTALFFEYSHSAVLDIPMLAFITLAMVSYLVWTRTDRPKLRWQILCALSMGIGCHFKGPVAILLPGLVMAIDSISRHRLRAFRSPRGYWIPIVAILILGLWFVPMAVSEGRPFVDYMFGKHIVGRAVSEEAPHTRPFHYYGPQLLASWLPWIFLAPLAWVTTLRAGLAARPDPRDENPLRFPFIWAVSIPLVLTFISSKRTQYLLPAVPGFAIWIAIAIEGWLKDGELGGKVGRGTVTVVRTVVIVGGSAAVTLVIVATIGRAFPLALPVPADASAELKGLFENNWAIRTGLLCAAIFTTSAWLLKRATPARLVLAVALVGLGGNQIRDCSLAGFRDRFIRANEFGDELRSLLAANGEIGVYAMRLNGTYLLHSGATHFDPVLDTAEITAFLDRDHPQGVIGKRRYLEEYVWPEFGERSIVVLAEHREGRSQVVLFGNDAAVELWRKLHPNSAPQVIDREALKAEK